MPQSKHQKYERLIARCSETALKRLGDSDYEKIYLYQNSRAGYQPARSRSR